MVYCTAMPAAWRRWRDTTARGALWVRVRACVRARV